MAISRQQPMRPAEIDLLDHMDSAEGNITQLQENLDQEVIDRQQADTALGTRINDETLARTQADTALGTRIDDETLARTQADTALGNRLDTVDDAIIDINSRINTNPENIEVDYTESGNIPIIENSYTQGATTDGTYIYVFAVGTSGSDVTPYITKYDSNFEIVNRFSFAEYPNIGHGNSIAYDQINNVIVIYSSNRYITIMSTDLEVISHNNVGTSSQVYNVSQIGISDTHMIVNLTGSNTFLFYYRFANTLFGIYGYATYDLANGRTNALQDCFIYNNYFYSMTSKINGHTYLDVFAVKGAYVCRFIFPNIQKEVEGCFYLDNRLMLVAADGYVYSANLDDIAISSVSPNDVIASNFVPIIARNKSDNWVNLNDYNTILTYNDNGINFSIPRKVFNNPFNDLHNKYFSANERIVVNGRNDWGVSYTAGGNLRCSAAANTIFCYLIFQYTVKGAYQFLNRIEVNNFHSGTTHFKNFTDDMTDETITENIVELMNNENINTLTLDLLGYDPISRTGSRGLQSFVEIKMA